MKVKDLILEMTGIEIESDEGDITTCTIKLDSSIKEALEREVKIEMNYENEGGSIYSIEEVMYDNKSNQVVIKI